MIDSQVQDGAVVSPDDEKKRHARERARRYRLSAKGKATAARQSERMKVRRAFRRSQRFVRLNRDRSLAFDGRFGGPIAAGVPSLGSLRLPSYREVTA